MAGAWSGVSDNISREFHPINGAPYPGISGQEPERERARAVNNGHWAHGTPQCLQTIRQK